MVTALIADLRARGVTLTSDGKHLRCRPRSALTAEDLKALRASKREILSWLANGRKATRVICHACRTSSFWLSIHGAVVCGICHPPASPNLVVRWIGGDVEASS
jgi:hypothetical protein